VSRPVRGAEGRRSAAFGENHSFREAAAEQRIQAVPFAHLSVELGHLYFEDFAAGPDHLRRHFERVVPWVAAARGILAAELPGRTPRASTCFLIDDYFAPNSSPAVVIPELLRAAEAAGLELDYLARESACVEAEGAPLARLVEERIVADPPPGTNGMRPPVTETGWLCNGQRSPGLAQVQAMEPAAGWTPPAQNAATRHSVFVDVELWDERKGERTWSCAFLAAVWQLLRLGLLRSNGARVAVPQPRPGDLPERWDQLPAVMQLRPRAAPFSAYRNLSILPGRFHATEHAVRTILSQVSVEGTAARQAIDRSQAEGISLPAEPVDRLEYIFTGSTEYGAGRVSRTAPPSPRAA
jgi:hypothetical protein